MSKNQKHLMKCLNVKQLLHKLLSKTIFSFKLNRLNKYCNRENIKQFTYDFDNKNTDVILFNVVRK